MLEKVSHVRNPLTVIAVFATLAEVSGTVVLPLIAEPTQSRFVWFLMIFPTLLVSLFFGTLVYKPAALYAPSDYKDEGNFNKNLIQPGSRDARRQKLDEEIADLPSEEPKPQADPAPNHIPPANDDIGNIPALGENENAGTVPVNSGKPSMERVDEFVHVRNLVVIESSFIDDLSQKYGLAFATNVRVGNGDVALFDAAAYDGSRLLVAEIKYSNASSYPTEIVDDVLNRAKRLHSTLSIEYAKSFEFIFAIAVGEDALAYSHVLSRKIQRKALGLSFPVHIEIRPIKDLLQPSH
jgi:hypothetical protein